MIEKGKMSMQMGRWEEGEWDREKNGGKGGTIGLGTRFLLFCNKTERKNEICTE